MQFQLHVSFAGLEENRDRFEPVGDDLFLMRPPATKRVANSVEFMGQMVSYPQYIRLMRIQKEVINMDKAKIHLIYSKKISRLPNEGTAQT